MGFLEDPAVVEVVEPGDLKEEGPLNVSTTVQRKGRSAPTRDVYDGCFRLTVLPDCMASAFDQQDISITASPPFIFRRSPQWEPTIFSTSRIGTSGTSYVADLPRRPGHVAVRSGSSAGKGDLIVVIEKTLYGEAVELYQGPYGRSATDGTERDPHEGVLTGRKGQPSFQYASTDDAIRAILHTKQPHVDGLRKFLALASFFRWQTKAKQEKMDAVMEATFTKDEVLQHSSLFIDETGKTLPKIGVRVAHDTGRGVNVDYSARGFESDPKSLLTFGQGTIGGAQKGARKLLAIDSEEDLRLKTPEVAVTTEDDTTIFVRLNDAAVLAARRSEPPWVFSKCKAWPVPMRIFEVWYYSHSFRRMHATSAESAPTWSKLLPFLTHSSGTSVKRCSRWAPGCTRM